MPAEYAIAPTGNALLYKIPGLSNMRACYRWEVIVLLGSWLLIVLLMDQLQSNKRVRIIMVFVVILLIISNLPHIKIKLIQDINSRKKFLDLDSSIIEDMKQDLHEKELVAFLPWGNDFYVNYLASATNIRTYNIGGDKNLEEASRNWPAIFRSFSRDASDTDFVNRVILLLFSNKAEAVILPYFNLKLGASSWPPPLVDKEKVDCIAQELKESKFFEVKEQKYYVVVRLAPAYINELREKLSLQIGRKIEFKLSNVNSYLYLKDGWYDPESNFTYSKDKAILNFILSSKVQDSKNQKLIMLFNVFDASHKYPKTVIININKLKPIKWVIDDSGIAERSISLPEDFFDLENRNLTITIHVPDATSQEKLGIGENPRVLGIALREIELL